jgi:hypothetical protein
MTYKVTLVLQLAHYLENKAVERKFSDKCSITIEVLY